MKKKQFSLGIDYEEFCLALHGSYPNEIHNTIIDDFYGETFELLQLLSSLEVKATFFVSSRTAEVYPEMVSLVASMGHEIASHGHRHIARQCMNDDEFLYDCQYSKGVLENMINKKVKGYRSPLLSISRSGYISALKILKKADYEYDSSIIKSKYKQLMRGSSGSKLPRISVVPLTELQLMGQCLNIAGGSIWRMLPASIVAIMLESRLTSNNTSLYIHPYEFARHIRLQRVAAGAQRHKIKDCLMLAKWNLNNRNTVNVIKRLSRRACFTQCSLVA
jgi:hypothetical protein